MKKYIVVSSLIILVIGILITLYYVFGDNNIKSPVGETIEKIKEKRLAKYSFPNLKKTLFEPLPLSISLESEEEENEDLEYERRLFSFQVPHYQKNNQTLQVSGMMNIPKEEGEYPVVVMIRGFVPKELYESGVGTSRGAQVLASNGFITVAPDFLGYGTSDKPSEYSMEDRFQTYTTTLSLFESLQNLNQAFEEASISARADTSKIGIWGHSNGGHIALSALAISGKSYPTVLWNPVSKPFPYSILFYTDEFDDEGKGLRAAVANFEEDYDVFQYSPNRYYKWIQAPIQLHQGANDEEVPEYWSRELYEKMDGMDKDITYIVHPNSDHNLMPGGWNTAIQQSLDFYKERFEGEN